MNSFEYAFVVFCDMRGFTIWSGQAAVGPHLKPFMSEFYEIFRSTPGVEDAFLKPNGDGILIVKSTGASDVLLDTALERFVADSLPFIDASFEDLIHRYQRIMRYGIPLRLGFGVSAGLVHRLEFQLSRDNTLTDFASGTLNVAARLCDLARPEGVVIAAEAFPNWVPPSPDYTLAEERVKGVSDRFPVWESKHLRDSAAPRERRQVALEFHVGTVCFDSSARTVLLAKRRSDRELYPGLWETGGGQMYQNEDIEQAAVRIARKEFGIDATVIWRASVVPFKIETSRRQIPGLKVLCAYSGSNAPHRDERQHDELTVVPTNDLMSPTIWPDELLIPGAKDVVRILIAGYERSADAQ